MRRQSAFVFSGFCAAILFAPVFFGSVQPWAYQSLSALLFFLFSVKPEAFYEILSLPAFFCKAVSLVLLWIILQSLFWAADKNAAQAQALQWLAFAAAFLMAQRLDLQQIRQLLKVLAAAAVFQAVYGVWQTLQASERVLWQVKEFHLGYVTGTYINRNHCAGLLELALGVTGGLFCEKLLQQKIMKAGGYGLIFLLLSAALIRTGSRFGTAAFVMTAVLAVFLGTALSTRLRRPFLILGLVFVAILLTQGWILRERFHWEDGYLMPISGRLWAWQDAAKMLQDYIFLGTGLGGFERVFPQYQSARLLLGWAHAHQDYLELATVLGLPFFILWLAGWSYFGFRVRTAFTAGSGAGCLAGGIAAGLISLVIHGLMDFNFAIPANAFLWVFLAGCLERLRRIAEAPEAESA